MSKILVVEDDTGLREVVVRVLQNEGHQVAGASNGGAALNLLEAAYIEGAQFHLVITDGNMPGIDGIELIKRMKVDIHLREVPVVLMTGRDTAYQGVARRVGAARVFQKTERFTELFEFVSTFKTT